MPSLCIPVKLLVMCVYTSSRNKQTREHTWWAAGFWVIAFTVRGFTTLFSLSLSGCSENLVELYVIRNSVEKRERERANESSHKWNIWHERPAPQSVSLLPFPFNFPCLPWNSSESSRYYSRALFTKFNERVQFERLWFATQWDIHFHIIFSRIWAFFNEPQQRLNTFRWILSEQINRPTYFSTSD